jgi:hypothetical protein
MKVSELTVEQLKALIKEAVAEELEEMLGDPDCGLALREEVRERLCQCLEAKEASQECQLLGEVAKQLGLECE